MRPRSKSLAGVRLEATIHELAPGGDGVAIAEIAGERRAIFVREVAVGDRLMLDVDVARRPARGRVVELLVASPDRIAAPCAHTARCGGCDWMHVSPAGQQRAHETHVRAALPAEWREAFEPIWHPAPARLGARARARLHVRGSGGRAILGMHEVGTIEPVEVDTCLILDPALDRARALLGPLLEGAHGRGDAQIALGLGAPVLELRWGGALPPAFFGRLEQAIALGQWSGARILQGETSKHAVIGDPTPWMRGADGAPLRLAPGGFAQSSEAANTILANRVAALAQATGAARIAELYAGAGNFTILLAKKRAEGSAPDVTAIEADGAACEAARENLRARALSAKVVEADASTFALPPMTQLLVLDPPRAGARAVVSSLAKSPVRHVVYVSCDTQTLGRDLAILATARYLPRAIELVEMFPGTSHVETVIALERPRK